VVYLRGDDYVARTLAWRDLAAAQAPDGAVSLAFHDVAAPAARLAVANAWPPALEAAR
jgi:hypothetical protein